MTAADGRRFARIVPGILLGAVVLCVGGVFVYLVGTLIAGVQQ